MDKCCKYRTQFGRMTTAMASMTAAKHLLPVQHSLHSAISQKPYLVGHGGDTRYHIRDGCQEQRGAVFRFGARNGGQRARSYCDRRALRRRRRGISEMEADLEEAIRGGNE